MERLCFWIQRRIHDSNCHRANRPNLRKVAPDFEIIAIDDCSRDGTAALAQQLADKFPEVRVVRHPVNLGIGPTLRDGYGQCRNEVVCAVPADGEFAVDCLRAGAEALINADVVAFIAKTARGR